MNVFLLYNVNYCAKASETRQISVFEALVGFYCSF